MLFALICYKNIWEACLLLYFIDQIILDILSPFLFMISNKTNKSKTKKFRIKRFKKLSQYSHRTLKVKRSLFLSKKVFRGKKTYDRKKSSFSFYRLLNKGLLKKKAFVKTRQKKNRGKKKSSLTHVGRKLWPFLKSRYILQTYLF
jgi:hypothetical protein